MAWTRRQPQWPFLAALACTLAATLAAPLWWRHRQAAQSASPPATMRTASVAHAVPPSPVLAAAPPAPVLPPLAEPRPALEVAATGPAQIAAPSLTGAVVQSDDYVVIDEPLVETAVASASATVPTAFDAPPSAVAESFANRTADEIIAARSVPAPEAPAQPAMTLAAIQRARDVLATLMDEAQRRTQELAIRAAELAAAASASLPQQSPPAPSEDNPPRVIVSSEGDRLAMVPATAAPTPPFTPATPRLAILPAPGPMPEPAPIPPALARRPTALIHDLEALTPATPAAAWADQTLAIIDQLTVQPASSSAAAIAKVEELRRLSSVGFNDALAVTDAGHQSNWIRAARALDRRLPLWSLLVDADAQRTLALHWQPSPADSVAVAVAAHQVAALLDGTTEGAAWRAYLRLDDIAGLASVGGEDYRDGRRAAAREALLRMASPQLTPAQQGFLSQPPLVALAQALRPWATGEVSLDALAALVESYELTGSASDAEAIAELRLRMRWSGDERLAALADELNRNYRNANMRIALSSELFARMIPAQEPTVAAVHDRIQGTEVHGQSRTETQVRIRLIPDATVWRMGLEVDGAVESRTYSDVGPARVRNVSRMEYEMRKLIMLNRNGLHISPAEAEVEGRNRLAGVESTLDPVPIVGAIVEDVVRRKHRENQAAAVAQVKAKVKRQARERMDREADAGLRDFQNRFSANVMSPLERFELVAEPVDMSTTEERAVMRLRLAREQHLGAHTPRPTAPSDSVASLQLHESALNNAIRSLGLDGRRLTVGELHDLLRARFTERDDPPPADLPQRAVVEFGPKDAVQVRCDGDRVELVLNIVELRKGRDSIRNVRVHAFFVAAIDGLEVKLVRDGGLQFEGRHLRTGPRLVLHSVFGKMLRADQEIPLLARRLSEDQRLNGLMVTQLVIDDGWVALSVGPASPERTAWRTRGAATQR